MPGLADLIVELHFCRIEKPVKPQFLFLAVLLTVAASPERACAVTKEEAVQQIDSLVDQVQGFSARLEILESAGGIDCLSTSSIDVSRSFGFRTDIFTSGVECQIVTDYSTSYQYWPDRQEVRKVTADRPEVRDLFRKPATDMNPLDLLDPGSIKLKGEESFEGEPVYRFEGTTMTRFLAQGEPITRHLEAWISVKDGLPRKTVETIGRTSVTTVYRDVKVNPRFTAEDFRFVPQGGVRVIDENEEFRKALERRPAPARGTPPGRR